MFPAPCARIFCFRIRSAPQSAAPSPALPQDDGTYRRFGEFLAEVKQASPTAYERIRDLGYPATITPEQREHFARISAGIRVS